MIIGLLILILILILYKVTTYQTIPKIIWTFWEGDENEVVNQCIQSWRKYNPEYTITIINRLNVHQYCNLNLNSHYIATDNTRLSDFVRLNVLAKFGGLWIDASIICNESFDWIHAMQRAYNYEFVGYYLDGFTEHEYRDTSPIIESWFFACIPNSAFVNDWRDEFMQLLQYNTVNDYIDFVKDSISSQNLPTLEYLTIHLSAQAVLQQNPNKYRLYVIKAETSAYQYLCDNDWNSENAIKSIPSYTHQPIIKMRGAERNALRDQTLIDTIFISNSKKP